MLYPQNNRARTVIDLSGVWDFRLTEDAPWEPLAVPGSYNDQKPDSRYREHCGLSWYRRRIALPAALHEGRQVLRFDAVTHNARVFLDGVLVGEHRGGFLPFDVDVTGRLLPGASAELCVEVDNRIGRHSLPVGNEGGVVFLGTDNANVPAVEEGKRWQAARGRNVPNFDFFNYCGINRPVRLCVVPENRIEDITLVPQLDGRVHYRVDTAGEGSVAVEIRDAEGLCVGRAEGAEDDITVENPHLWEPRPGTPYLYTAHVTFAGDEYDQTFGFRTVEVRGHEFLLNGKPFHFHGPCKHEDSAIHGRGTDPCLNVADIALFGWLHANCFRTSHYPYAEEMYALCDREGIVIIDETPAVGIAAGTRENPYAWGLDEYHADVLRALIARDKNHPCVVMWSLGNEPDTDIFHHEAFLYWRRLYELAHASDPQNRPVTLVCCQNNYPVDEITRTMDVLCLNRYYGWYNLSGDLEAAQYALRRELDFWAQFDKPVILSEYGADTIAGLHGAVAEMFTEEFQVAFYEAFNACLDERPFVIGEMPWNFADFGTAQSPMRAGGNRKGLFTRDRRPKMAAHYFRRRWSEMEAE